MRRLLASQSPCFFLNYASRFTVRDFTFDESQLAKQSAELESLKTSERELWNEVLRVSQTNLAEAVELTSHLRLVRGYVECLLRYGLPAAYFFANIKVSLSAYIASSSVS